MPIRASWLLEGRIVFTVMEGELTREDITAYDERLIVMMTKEATGAMHNIIDLRGITKQANLKDVLRVKSLHHPLSRGWGVTIGAMNNPLARMLTSIVTSLAKARYRDVKNMHEALELLRQKDNTLPDLTPLLDKIV